MGNDGLTRVSAREAMQVQASWVHAQVDWCGFLNPTADDPSQRSGAIRLATWPRTEFDPDETDCYAVGDQMWIWQPGVGAVRFRLDEPTLVAYQWPGCETDVFRQVVTRSWLPAIYPLWGRQVLHASAVVCPATGHAAAFTGPTHAGKSTTAYGVSRLGNWRLLSDDTVGFSLAGSTNRLHPLPNESRLRTASANYYGVQAFAGAPLLWPEGDVQLRVVYALEGLDAADTTVEFTPLRAAEAVPLLLQQAFTLSFELPKYNQQLMKDYLALASTVPAYRLRYRRSFDVADELFRAVQDHLSAVVGVSCSAPSSGPNNA